MEIDSIVFNSYSEFQAYLEEENLNPDSFVSAPIFFGLDSEEKMFCRWYHIVDTYESGRLHYSKKNA